HLSLFCSVSIPLAILPLSLPAALPTTPPLSLLRVCACSCVCVSVWCVWLGGCVCVCVCACLFVYACWSLQCVNDVCRINYVCCDHPQPCAHHTHTHTHTH